MGMKNSPIQEDIPLIIAGSTKFGREPKISIEQTFNLMISDNWLVDFPGYKRVIEINPLAQGRRIYTSVRAGIMIAVIDNTVYRIEENLNVAVAGVIETFLGDVFVAENTNNEIAICDKKDIWIYNTDTLDFEKAVLNFIPGYVAYQDLRFIAPDITAGNPAQWRLSALSDGLSWPDTLEGKLQTKADNALAAFPMPGRGNLLLLMGNIVGEQWFDSGASPFPYTRVTTTNIDYGLANVATLAFSDQFCAFLGINEKSGLAILVSEGGKPEPLSTDGIDLELGKITHPQSSYGFFFKQYGHVLYIITFFHSDDNVSYMYDFKTNMFFTLTDEQQNYYIVKNVAFFNNTYYFLSINDGNVYEINNKYNSYDYGDGNIFEIPRIRITQPIRYTEADYFKIQNLTFTVGQGNDPTYLGNPANALATEDGDILLTESGEFIGTEFTQDIQVPRIDIALSKDGGISFGNFVSKILNPLGRRKNRLNFWQLGIANDVSVQIRFVGFYGVQAADGLITVIK